MPDIEQVCDQIISLSKHANRVGEEYKTLIEETSTMQEQKGNVITLQLQDIAGLLGPVLTCADPKDPREALRHVEFKVVIDATKRPHLQAVASDGRRLILRSALYGGTYEDLEGIPLTSPFYTGLLLDHETCKTFVSLAKKLRVGEVTLEILEEGKVLSITINGPGSLTTSQVALPDCKFPPYKQLFDYPNSRKSLDSSYKSVSKIMLNPALLSATVKACPSKEVAITMPQKENEPVFLHSREQSVYIWIAIIMPIIEPQY